MNAIRQNVSMKHAATPIAIAEVIAPTILTRRSFALKIHCLRLD